MREWFAEVQRRLETGSDPFLEAAAGRTGGDKAGEVGETQGEASTVTAKQPGTGVGDEDDDDDDDDEGDEDDDAEDTDDSEVWEPSRSVRKSLSVSED